MFWKSFHLCFPTNLTKCSSPPCLPSSSAAATKDPNRPSLLLYHSSYESDHNNYEIAPPDFTAVFASGRFFFSSPGHSNAITDSPRELSDYYDNATTSTTSMTAASPVSGLLSGGVAVTQHVHSQDPYRDFRRSMEEMIDAVEGIRAGVAAEGSYKFLQELLLSYLSLNSSDTHDFIIRAFADILLSLLSDARRRC